MIAEESSEIPGGSPPPHPTERDLLAERRARRAIQVGDPALVRRAEAAEATVQTLQTHLSSLQQRLREAEEERRHGAQRLAASENELRRVKQQEYAEQQLRVEAERTLTGATSERSAAAGASGRSEAIQRLQARVAEVERRAARLAEEIESERRARERTERALEGMRESYRAMAATVGELRDVASRLRDAAVSSTERTTPLDRPPGAAPGSPAAVPSAAVPPAPSERLGQEPSGQAQREEMADALAAAVERLRARAEESLPPSREPVSPPLTGVAPTSATPAAASKPHKHSMSLIGRWRAARKHRREVRQAAAGSPNIAKHR